MSRPNSLLFILLVSLLEILIGAILIGAEWGYCIVRDVLLGVKEVLKG